jgi:hypothetical protein
MPQNHEQDENHLLFGKLPRSADVGKRNRFGADLEPVAVSPNLQISLGIIGFCDHPSPQTQQTACEASALNPGLPVTFEWLGGVECLRLRGWNGGGGSAGVDGVNYG